MLPVAVVPLVSLISEHNSAWENLLQFTKIQAEPPSFQGTNTQSQSADSRESNS